VTTNFHNPGGGRFTHYASPRTLTLREALRLQGFPDTFRFDCITPTDARRLVGNAFPRLLAEIIGRHVARLLR
jgi:DNA (cytosine-5)-methyltransferase 1